MLLPQKQAVPTRYKRGSAVWLLQNQAQRPGLQAPALNAIKARPQRGNELPMAPSSPGQITTSSCTTS